MQFAAVRDQGKIIDLQRCAAGDARFTFDAEQPAGNRGGPVAYLQPRSPQGAEKLRERSFVAGGNPQVAQLPLDRRSRSVCHARNASAVEVQNGE